MYLNNDVATEILLRLPVQSLLRFRTVSKCWCNLIDSSTFRTSQFHHQSENKDSETLLLHFYRGSPGGVSILNADCGKWHEGFPAFQEFSNTSFGSGFLSVSSPVNGLICIYNNEIAYSSAERPTIGIYNPCLDKIKILPLSPILSTSSYEWNRGDCSRTIGFGLDNDTKDYKLVQLISFHVEGRTCVEVYSGTTNTWRKLVTDYNFYIDDFVEIKSKSGSWAHWETYWRKENEWSEYVILSFNMQNELFETIPCPRFDTDVVDMDSRQVLAKDDDSFAFFVHTWGCCIMKVWEVECKDNKRRWTHVTDVDVQEKNWSFPRAFWKRDVVVCVDEHCYYEQPDSIIFYNYSTGEVIKRCEMPKVMPKYFTLEIFEYKSSLILP